MFSTWTGRTGRSERISEPDAVELGSSSRQAGRKRVKECVLQLVGLGRDTVEGHATDHLAVDSAILDRVDSASVGRREDLIAVTACAVVFGSETKRCARLLRFP